MTDTTPTDFKGLVDGILTLVSYIIPLIFSVMFLYFIWRIIDAWVINAGDEKKREEGKLFLVIAIVAFVLMMTIWGIVGVLKDAVL